MNNLQNIWWLQKTDPRITEFQLYSNMNLSKFYEKYGIIQVLKVSKYLW